MAISYKKALDAMCRSCIYDPKSGGGTWREQVAQCSCHGCPLWPIRAAPSGGKFASPPRKVEETTQEWLKAPVGMAFSPHPSGK